MKYIELLAPAKDLHCGIEAINNGADAVYIGAEALGARASATNTTDDIARLADYAHVYGVKIYVTLNTILYNHELDKAYHMAMRLVKAGADALIIQDTAWLQMGLPIPLHASTQMDNRTAEQVAFLQSCGIKRTILARELGLEDIQKIHKQCPEMELEAFVHGALCISYSGRCYASQHCFGRSANRGECAQFCRLAFRLQDREGNTLAADKHLLSLKDMNRSNYLEEMMNAGICSFKIEGRLKGPDYVKNITAYYHQRINSILSHKKDWFRASYGHCEIPFTPDPQKSFNRGFTDCFLHENRQNSFSFHTPKSIGKVIGTVKEISKNSIKVAGIESLHNGDGLCFYDERQQLQGFRVNKAVNNIVYPNVMPKGIKPRMSLFRNFDQDFHRQLMCASEQRTLSLHIKMEESENGFLLHLSDETGRKVCLDFPQEKIDAHSSQRERQVTELSKWGDTPFRCVHVDIATTREWFIPASIMAQWRRESIKAIMDQPLPRAIQKDTTPVQHDNTYPSSQLDFSANIANRMAEHFYRQHGVERTEKAYELQPAKEAPLMICKHCLRYAMGYCRKEHHPKDDVLKEPLFLTLDNNRKFRLQFDCTHCQMIIYATP